MKTEVYSWRVSAELKTSLEREARKRRTSLSQVLDLAAKEWLRKIESEIDDAPEQLRLHQAAAECLGAFATGDARRAENARQLVRERLRRNAR